MHAAVELHEALVVGFVLVSFWMALALFLPLDFASTLSAASGSAAPAASTAASTTSYIGDAAAKDIALKHAGLAESNVTSLKIELDTDDAVAHYDIDFKAGGMEYDYDINATTGEIMQSKAEVDD